MSHPSSGESTFPPPTVVVIDTSTLIEMKRIVPLKEQWALFVRMTALVDSGHLAFPRQVSTEMTHIKFPDTPGTWAAGCDGHARHPDPRDEAIAEVMGIAQLVDPNDDSPFEPADPYVVAMAWEIHERHPECRVIVATNDYVDRMPSKEALSTACARLRIECWKPSEYLVWLDEQRQQTS